MQSSMGSIRAVLTVRLGLWTTAIDILGSSVPSRVISSGPGPLALLHTRAASKWCGAVAASGSRLASRSRVARRSVHILSREPGRAPVEISVSL